MTEILPELWNTNDITCSLVFEADKEDGPDSIDAPEASPGVLAEGGKFADLMVFLVGEVSELTSLSWCRVYRSVFVDLDIVRLMVDGEHHNDGT